MLLAMILYTYPVVSTAIGLGNARIRLLASLTLAHMPFMLETLGTIA